VTDTRWQTGKSLPTKRNDPMSCKTSPKITVEWFEARRFHVNVRGKPGHTYLVDLDEYRGNGWCGCQDFEFRRSPRLIRGQTSRSRCKHIRHALAAEWLA